MLLPLFVERRFTIVYPYRPRFNGEQATSHDGLARLHVPGGAQTFTFAEVVKALEVFNERWWLQNRWPPPNFEAIAVEAGQRRVLRPLTFTLREYYAETEQVPWCWTTDDTELEDGGWPLLLGGRMNSPTETEDEEEEALSA